MHRPVRFRRLRQHLAYTRRAELVKAESRVSDLQAQTKGLTRSASKK
jgi:hypothetical protein